MKYSFIQILIRLRGNSRFGISSFAETVVALIA